MKRLFLFSMLLIFSPLLCDTWYLSNETGTKLGETQISVAQKAPWALKVAESPTGITEELFKNGSLYERREFLYKDDILVQSRTYRYGSLINSKSFADDGRLLEETNYSADEKKGKRKYLYGPAGMTGCEFYSPEGKLEYSDSYILDEEGRISFIYRTSEGGPKEYFKYSYDAGILRSFIHQNGGLLSYILYNKNQRPEKEITTQDGKIVRSVYNEYRSDSLVRSVLSDMTEQKKIETEYDSEQRPVIEKEYFLREDGNVSLLSRTEFGYAPSGELNSKTLYADGVKTETSFEYDSTGKIIAEKELRDGNLFRTDVYQGTSMERKLFHEGQLYVTIRFENGKKTSETFETEAAP
jgi:antitoxin component YwqK of YwqJK toxin-antitoxin module